MKPQNHMKPPNLAFGWLIGEVEIKHKKIRHFRRRLPQSTKAKPPKNERQKLRFVLCVSYERKRSKSHGMKS